METNIEYQRYIADTQNLKIQEGRLDYQAPYANDFEIIYENAMNKDVNLSSAKNFINSLSNKELVTVQKYTGLADAIDKGSLSSEAAYNLLVHDNEQFDFNGDGIIKVGAASMVPVVPRTMPSDVRRAYIEALNSLDGKDRLMAMTLTFDMGRIISLVNNTPYIPQTIDYAYLSQRVDSMLNPTGGAMTSESTKVAIKTFWEAFEKAYSGEKVTKESQTKDPAVKKFIEDLLSKGAIAFLAELDQKKIEEKIKEYEAKLIKELGSSDKSLTQIAKLVEDYKKQLLEELEIKFNGDEKKSKVNSQAVVKILLDMKTDSQNNLENVLQKSS